MAAAAPMFAASPCQLTQSYRLDWGKTAYAKNGNVGAAVVAGPAGTQAVTVTFTSVIVGQVVRATDNLTVSPLSDVGDLGTSERALNIAHADGIVAGRGNRQDIAISFTRAVTGLSFSITDIDSSRQRAGGPFWAPEYEGWYDRVELTGTRTPEIRPGAGVVGIGTNSADTTNASGPWRLSDNNLNVANTGDSRGVVKVTYPGTIAANTPIYLTFWSALGGGNQRIFLSDLTFTAKGC